MKRIVADKDLRATVAGDYIVLLKQGEPREVIDQMAALLLGKYPEITVADAPKKRRRRRAPDPRIAIAARMDELLPTLTAEDYDVHGVPRQLHFSDISGYTPEILEEVWENHKAR